MDDDLSYRYDAASNRTSLTDAAGFVSSYSYDSLNRLTGLTNTNSGSFGLGYDALGRRTSLTRPNGVNTSYSYDTLSRLLGVLHNGGALPGSASYTYDAAGNRLTKTAVQEASPNPVSVLSQYSYDPIYELTQAVVNSSVAESYSYDVVGNRLSSAGPVSYNYNASNELTSTSAATYTYDNNGNTITKTTSAGMTSYTWDFENRLASMTLPGTGGTVNFKYDPFGRRVEKIAPTTGTTIYAYDGANVTAELGAGGNLLAYYTHGADIDEPLGIAESGGTYYYHPDGLGSITSLTNGAGQLANSYVYDSFGNLTASTGTVTNPFQYTGREFDSETGLYYYRARYYDGVAGRFLSEDPIQFEGGDNFYAYVRNSPVMLVDPSGLSPACCNEKDPTNKRVLDFMRANIAQAQILAQQLNVPVANILGLASEESTQGTSNVALNAHNFFGIHAGAAGSIGTYTTSGGANVSVFPAATGFLTSGQSFVNQWGPQVSGQANAGAFANALVPSFNTANAKTGGNPDFVSLVTGAINGIKRRLICLK
jgi:RHS repeat-associated protein